MSRRCFIGGGDVRDGDANLGLFEGRYKGNFLEIDKPKKLTELNAFKKLIIRK
jgi:hypothetical protein